MLPKPLTLVTVISTPRLDVPPYPALRPPHMRKETPDSVRVGALQGCRSERMLGKRCSPNMVSAGHRCKEGISEAQRLKALISGLLLRIHLDAFGLRMVQGVEKHYNGVLPELDALEDMHVTELEAVEAAQKLAELQRRLVEHKGSLEAPVSLFLVSWCTWQSLV